jgi:hypothetical protein
MTSFGRLNTSLPGGKLTSFRGEAALFAEPEKVSNLVVLRRVGTIPGGVVLVGAGTRLPFMSVDVAVVRKVDLHEQLQKRKNICLHATNALIVC